jgi:hypothetical protein
MLAVKRAHSFLIVCFPYYYPDFGFRRLLTLHARRVVTRLAPVHSGACAFIFAAKWVEVVLGLFLPAFDAGFHSSQSTPLFDDVCSFIRGEGLI